MTAKSSSPEHPSDYFPEPLSPDESWSERDETAVEWLDNETWRSGDHVTGHFSFIGEIKNDS